MRKATIFLTLSILVLGTGCKSEIIIFAPGTNTEEQNSEIGYLTMTGLSVAEVAEEISSGSASGSTNSNRVAVSRASEAPDDYIVKILNQKTSEEQEYTYSALKSIEGGRLALQPGTYTISAESPNYADYISTGAQAEWEIPVYRGEVTKIVQTRQETEVNDLVCKLANIKTTVSLSQDMMNLFMSDAQAESEGKQKLNVTLSVDEASLTYDRATAASGREGYFKVETGNTVTMKIVLTGEYNVSPADQEPKYTTINWTNELPDCRSGQWRKISIGVTDADSGNVQFNITVENWVYDEPVEVNVMQTYSYDEETIPDEEVSDDDAPSVELADGDIDRGYDITGSMYDSVLNKWFSNLRVNFVPESGRRINEIIIGFESDNESFINSLQAAGFDSNNIVLWPSNDALGQYAVLTESQDGILIAVVKDEGMSALYSYTGTHKVKFTATDNHGRTSYTTLEIRVSAGGDTAEAGPVVKWTDKNGSKTYDFNKRYPHNSVEIVVEVTTQSVFTTFTVDIISENVLPPDELSEVGLSDRLDLINPGEYREKLQNFGFPTDDDITGTDKVSFDITNFMDLLSMLNKEGDCDFRLTVGDAAGTVVKTIQLHVSNN